jgi:HAD superfamily hydrolase (TIGR01450 family)
MHLASLFDAGERVSSARAILLDWDGCLVHGDQLAPGALEILQTCRDRIVLLSNQSAVESRDIQAFLRRRNIDLPIGQIMLAGEFALNYVKSELPDARIHLIASDTLRDQAQKLRLRLVETENADVVLVLRDPKLSFAQLGPAIAAIRRGARLLAANPDRTHPSATGAPVVETGTIAEAISFAAFNAPIQFLGKPRAEMFEAALSIMNASPLESVMIGDNPETDGAGAMGAGIPFLQIEAPSKHLTI